MTSSRTPRQGRRAAAQLSVAAMGVVFFPVCWSMDYRTSTTGKTNIQYVVVTAPLASTAVRVMIPSQAIPLNENSQRPYTYIPRGSALVSIEATTTTPYVASLPPGPVAVISGSFSGSDPSRPNALVIADGEVNKQLNLTRATPRGDSQRADCPSLKKYRWSGVFCSTGQSIKILPVDSLEANGFADVEKCRDALQSFPLIVEPNGKNAICTDEPTRSSASGAPPSAERRALICLTPTEIKLIVTGPTYLYTLAEHLIKVEGCVTALNLSGSVQAGLGYRANPHAQWIWWPQTNKPRPPLSSVIVVSESDASMAPPHPRPMQKRSSDDAQRPKRSLP